MATNIELQPRHVHTCNKNRTVPYLRFLFSMNISFYLLDLPTSFNDFKNAISTSSKMTVFYTFFSAGHCGVMDKWLDIHARGHGFKPTSSSQIFLIALKKSYIGSIEYEDSLEL